MRAPKLYRHTHHAKPNGTHRKISEPAAELKEVQRAFARSLSELPLEDGIFGGPKTTIMHAMHPHCDKPLLVKMDLKDFYPSIKLRRIERYLQTVLDKPKLAVYFARICTTDKHLPQGAPSSPVLARLILQPAFIATKAALKAMDGRCEVSAWVDDVSISGPIGIKRAQPTIKRIFEKHHFTVNDLKTEIVEGKHYREGLGLLVGKVLEPCAATMTRYQTCLREEPWNNKRRKGFENFFRDIQKVDRKLSVKDQKKGSKYQEEN
jgi:hypothetical protein